MARFSWRRVWLPLAGAVLVLCAHELWYRTFPQVQDFPPDQAAYLIGGRSLLAALPAIATLRFNHPSVEAARHWFDFFGVALFYGIVDAIRPNDLSFFRHVLALLNAVAAVGVWNLAFRIGGTPPAMVAMLFFIVSPAFPSGASRLYPDALTSALIVWSLAVLVEARTKSSALLAGAFLGSALLIRVQLVPWIPALLVLLFAATFRRWRSDTDAKRTAQWAGLGFLATGILFAVVSLSALENEDPRSPKHNLPKYQKYAAGVWRFLDSDGWDGPYRQNQEPFYDALVAASAQTPEVMTSRARQYVFAAGYLWDRRAESIPLVLDNMFRTFGVPQNPEHRSLAGGEAPLLFLHRLSLVAAVVGGLVACARGGLYFLVPALPLFVAIIHAFAFPWPRYAMSVLPVVIALSGVGIWTMLQSLVRVPRRAVAVAVGLTLLLLASRALSDASPEGARALTIVAVSLGIAAVGALTLDPGANRRFRVLSMSAFAGLALIAFAHEWRSPLWHERRLSLRDGDVLRQEITLDGSSLTRLREHEERFLVIDAEVSARDARPWALTINGLPAELMPTIPPLPEAIPVVDEGRLYPQWWAARLTTDMVESMARAGTLIAEIRIANAGILSIKGDRFAEQNSLFEAPSFGEWPFAVELKPEYDRDYRLFVRRPLRPGATRTSIRRDGATIPLKAMARIRLLALEDKTGSLIFEATKGIRSPYTRDDVLTFDAQSGIRDRANGEIRVNGDHAVTFPIGRFRDYAVEEGPWRLCYVDRTPNAPTASEGRGTYFLSGPLECRADRCGVEIRFWPGFDRRRLFFRTETIANQSDEARQSEGMGACGFGNGAPGWRFGRLVDGSANSYPEDRGRWGVAAVF